MKIFLLVRRGLVAAVFSPLILLSFVVRKNRSIWVFGAWNGRQYSDNPRYLFESVNANETAIHPIWISKSRDVVRRVTLEGYSAYYWASLKGIFYSLRAGVAVVSHSADDVNPYASYHSKLFKITHGTPMKCMGVDDKASYPGKVSQFFYHHFRAISPQRKSPMVAFVSSELSKARFESAYRGSSIIVVNSGYPRWQGILANHDVLWNLITGEAGVRRGEQYDKVIMYAPTRRAQTNFRLDISYEFAEFVLKANQRGYFVVFRPHPSLKVSMTPQVKNRLACLGFLEVTCQQLNDVSSALQDVDVLVTDYSSIIYDYCILRRPAFLFAPDLDDYVSRDTGLYAPYGEFEPAVWIDTLEAALETQALEDAVAKSARFQDQHASGDALAACSRIVSDIKDRL